MTPDLSRLFDAVSFAARAHAGQLRKDGRTPYASHPVRVALVVRCVFGVDDPDVLTAAVLHDTIEDTTTDYDDIAERFGPRVADWVRLLTKDKRLPDDEREEDYARGLADADWQVQVIKLADVFDNLNDVGSDDPVRRERALRRGRFYLNRMSANLREPARPAFALVETLVTSIQ
jgi:(p)ppGpp synthase/HD superfamily hydrolase